MNYIIGSGFSGLTVAYALYRKGIKSTIISPADHFTLMIEMFVRGVRESQARKTFWDDAESQASLMDLISKAIP